MNMFPAQNLSTQHCYGGYVGGGRGCPENLGLMNRLQGYVYDCSSEAWLGSDLVVSPLMAAEDESGSNEAAGSKDVQEEKDRHEDGWLQLSIGGHETSRKNSKQDQEINYNHHQNSRKGELIELNLLQGNSSSSSMEQGRFLAPRFHDVPEFQTPRQPPPLSNITSAATHCGYGASFLLQHPGTSSNFPRQETNWIYRPMPLPFPGPGPIASSPSSSSSFSRPGGLFARSFPLQGGINIPGPDIDFRVINPPRRPHSGVWFILQASQNQGKEPFLPQIPKSYLRIKDGRMTIRLVMKYLANKLRLESESEVEITCRGQQIPPFLTLQHVRDHIWSLRDSAVTLLPDSSTNDHVMMLQYSRNSQLP